MIRRFHRNGNCWKPNKQPKPFKIPPAVEKELVSWEVLNEWRYKPIYARVRKIKEKYNISISKTTLVRLYKRNKVKYRPTKKHLRWDEKKEMAVIN